MKKIVAILMFIPFLAVSQSQIKYEIELDDPADIPWLTVNLDLFSMDVPVNNIDGTSFYLGLWGYVKPTDKLPIVADYNFKRSYLALGAIGDKEFPVTSILQFGGRFNFLSTTKTKNTKVIVDSKTVYVDTKNVRNQEATKTTYVTVPAKRKNVTAGRVGFYRKSRGYVNEDVAAFDFTSELNTTGVYAGIMLSNFRNVSIKTGNYGSASASKGIDLYADAIFAGSKFTKVSDGTDLTALAETALEQQTPVGLRIGVQTYEIEKKLYTDKTFGMNYNFEVGILPYEGIYFQGGVTLTLVKAKGLF